MRVNLNCFSSNERRLGSRLKPLRRLSRRRLVLVKRKRKRKREKGKRERERERERV